MKTKEFLSAVIDFTKATGNTPRKAFVHPTNLDSLMFIDTITRDGPRRVHRNYYTGLTGDMLIGVPIEWDDHVDQHKIRFE